MEAVNPVYATGFALSFQGLSVVANDGSGDRTAEEARSAGAHVIDLPFNSGYGVALSTGLIWAYRNGAELVVTEDGDGQHDAQEALRLVEPVLNGDADLVLGSRYAKGSACYHVPFTRRLGSMLFAVLLSVLSRTRITDPTTGFQCLNRKALKLLAELPDFPERTPDADIILYAFRRGLRIAEVPVAMYADVSNDSMHSLSKSLFYVPKMLVSMLSVILSVPVVPAGARER